MNKLSGYFNKNNGYDERQQAEFVYFLDRKTKGVHGLIDVDTEDMYVVPPGGDDWQSTHHIFSAVCISRNIPFLDKSKDFPIAIPMDFYIDITSQFGSKEQQKNAVEFKETLQRIWSEHKSSNEA
jgi:hypothetical protein